LINNLKITKYAENLEKHEVNVKFKRQYKVSEYTEIKLTKIKLEQVGIAKKVEVDIKDDVDLSLRLLI
jgi:hypothetical protein